jgi:hypothetical protein
MFAQQADFFPEESASYAPDPSRIRAKLNAVLLELRRAEAMPWDRKTRAYHQLVYPQMTRALPQDEAVTFRLAFEAELKRFD